jgi:hypothetical protein
MARMKIRPGGKTATAPTERHPVEVATDSVILTDFERPNAETGEIELVPAFSFATAEGRGTSPEIVPFDELDEYVAVLRAAEEAGVPRREVTAEDKPYVPTHLILQSELRLGEYKTKQKDGAKNDVKGPDGKPVYDSHGDRIFLRSRDGRGAKTQKIREDHFSAFVDFVDGLRGEREPMLELWTEELPGLLVARAEEQAAEAAKVAAAAEDNSQD